MTKAETFGYHLEKRIEDTFWKHGNQSDFWEYEAKRVYSAMHDLISYANKLEKENHILREKETP